MRITHERPVKRTHLYEVVGEAWEVRGARRVAEQLGLVGDAAFDALQQGCDGGYPLFLSRGAAG